MDLILTGWAVVLLSVKIFVLQEEFAVCFALVQFALIRVDSRLILRFYQRVSA